MKLVVTGASGLVGHAVVEAAARRGFEVVALSHRRDVSYPEDVQSLQTDLTPEGAADRLLLEVFPDVIVNCAAASSATTVNKDPEAAERLNVALPRRLAQLANHLNARLIHFSTDMVFDGTSAPYRSSDMPAPLDLYGQLKLLAEREVLKAGGDYATVLRIPIVTGDSPSGGRSVHERLFSAWAEGKKARLYNDELRQPVSATSIAELVVELCLRPNLHGLFHWAGADVLSRYEMGTRIARHFGLPEDLIEEAQSDPDERRARDLRLELQPLRSKVRTTPPTFDEQLETMSVPKLCRAWYASIRGVPADEVIPTRLVKGRDF